LLWNFEENEYHEWVEKEKINERLAPVFPSDEVITIENNISVGVGLHDSSSALIPYLASFHQPFILISTGTWCISLNPFNEAPLTDAELERDCLSFLTFKGKPVKASRLFAGHEHEKEIQRIAAHFGKPLNYFETVIYNAGTVSHLQDKFEQDMEEDFHPGPSMFHERELNAFTNYEEAYHQLVMDIMRRQVMSTNLVAGNEKVNRIFVDGGFGKNPIYMNLLAIAYPDVEVYAASVAQATAIGAALAIHKHWNPEPVPADLIDLKYYSAARLSP
jgi:sugar (pentulose or hexulose) kinase